MTPYEKPVLIFHGSAKSITQGYIPGANPNSPGPAPTLTAADFC